MRDDTVDLWALDEVHFQQQGSRCRMWIPPENRDPVVYHHPTRKSVGYFAAVRLRDGRFLFRRETGRFNGESFLEFLKQFRQASPRGWSPRDRDQRQRAIPSFQISSIMAATSGATIPFGFPAAV